MTTILPGKGVEFRVWAPKHRAVEVVFEEGSVKLTADDRGYFAGVAESARAGTLYRFKLGDDDYLYPDPASRFQPAGPHGPSQVIDPSAFEWTDDAWPGLKPEGHIVYELHIGTFTPEGTFEAARAQLEELAAVGITVIELMPIAEFSGRWGWGYDGVDLFAPTHLYGSCDDVRRFIDTAHRLGLGVILDVVYNHLGPDGNYLKGFADDYFTDRFKNDWGEAINFSSGPVRDFYLANAAYWVKEFHFDGLRLDATQDVQDLSPEHILAAMTKHVRKAAGDRSVYFVAENEPQNSRLVRPHDVGGYGIDALWNDDFHHSAQVAISGRNEAYYTDYLGSPQEFLSAAKFGYLYQGQRYKWQKNPRGTAALDLEPSNFITFLQNHDQVANSAYGERPNLLTGPAMYRAMSALLLLSPGTPMLFQGQEFGATTPFFYFCDHAGELCDQVDKGRKKFLSQFRSLAQPELQKVVVHPGDNQTFTRSKLDFGEREKNAKIYQLYKDLIRLRREDPVLRAHRRHAMDGAVLCEHAFLFRYFGGEWGDRLLIV
ncbi:MAG: malto-oligosyltrehalose trehalohydrolase, partial [Acidobacteriota bacterium]|nr:malto-oligosyltrehalose trehalohydrolase [Acidobacteriota bacterium]